MNKNIKLQRILLVLLILFIVGRPVCAYEHAEDFMKSQEERDAKLIQTIKIFRKFEDGANNKKIEQIIKNLIADHEKQRMTPELAKEIEKVERMREELDIEDEARAQKRKQEDNYIGAYDLTTMHFRTGSWVNGAFYDLEDAKPYQGFDGVIQRGK